MSEHKEVVIDGITYVPKVEQGTEPDGFFPAHCTWDEAIELLTMVNKGFVGGFELLKNGQVAFNIGMSNNRTWAFTKGKLLVYNPRKNE
jgi:hypothetical protein